MNTIEETMKRQMVNTMTERTDELLRMILDLKQDKEIDIYRMQKLVVDTYKEELDLLNVINNLESELDKRKRKSIEIPKFMFKEKSKEAQ